MFCAGKSSDSKFSRTFFKKILAFFCILLFKNSFFFAQTQKINLGLSEEITEEKTVITILNALKSSNVKDKENDEDLILFEGSVKISVEKGQTKTVISADQITYSRKHEMLYAEGNVKIEQTEKSGSVSNINATSVLFNTSTLEGIFDDGRIVQADNNSINLPSGSTLVVGSDVFARNHSGTVAFKHGELTFCNAEHPHWKIKASRIWLLPGNEFAFFNAVLFMDNIPVLYLPAFYYPKDELIFNPVFGYKNRQGFFTQTTTYLFGRKPLEKEAKTSSDDDVSKYFNFVKPTKLMDQELQGIVLHNLDTVYKGDTANYLKFTADWYSNLGVSLGVDGVYKPKKIFSTLEGNFMLGFGNTIFQNSANYFPFDSSGTRHYESSNFMGVEIPFRYRAFFKVAVNEPFSLTLTMPVYSDPFFNYDYGERKETMDWFSYLLNNPLTDNTETTEQQKLDASEISSFAWDLTGSYSMKLNDNIKPYINSVSVSSFNSSINFASKSVDTTKDYLSKTDNYHLYTPQRKFFYPSQITPVKINAKISGTLLSFGTDSSKSKNQSVSFPVDLIPTEELMQQKSEEEKKAEEKKGFDFERDGLPDISFSSSSSVSSAKDFAFNLNYSFAPDFVSQFTYSAVGINTGSEFKWDRIQSSYIYLKMPVSIDDTITVKNNFLSMKNTFTFTPVYQTHPYLSTDTAYGGYTQTNINSIKKSDYSSTSMELLNSNSISIKPFVYYPVFKDTGLSYNTAIKFLRTKFIGDAENPEWDILTVDPEDSDSITTHSVDLTLAAKELDGDFSQSLILSSTLSPQIPKYYGTLKLAFPFVTLTTETGIKQKSKTDKDWTKEPFKEALSVSLFDKKLNFTQSYNYDIENSRSDALKLALSYSGFQLAYTMKYTNPYDFDSAKGWVKKDNSEFIPYNASFAYTSTAKTFKFLNDKISFAPTLSTSVVIDFVRPTNSYFIFSPGITFKINNFIDISFSSTSRNDVLYRYVQGALGTPQRIPGEENIFVDLFNSFRFDDESLRKASGFKLKSLNFKITHDLHDWDLKCEFKIEPRLITPTTGTKYYDFSPYFSISVVWRPMESMKTEILDDYGTWKLK